jgi:hypothetical protein
MAHNSLQNPSNFQWFSVKAGRVTKDAGSHTNAAVIDRSPDFSSYADPVAQARPKSEDGFLLLSVCGSWGG